VEYESEGQIIVMCFLCLVVVQLHGAYAMSCSSCLFYEKRKRKEKKGRKNTFSVQFL